MKTIALNADDFQTLAIQSFRYCLGRKTYAVSECADFIRKHWQDLTPNTKHIIDWDLIHEIAIHELSVEKGKTGTLGMECDYAIWKNLAEWIKEQK